MGIPMRLMTVAAAGIVVSTMVSFASWPTAHGAAVPAVTSTAPVSGRILFAGTQHRSLGVVTGPGPSAELFGPGPAHFDDQPNAVAGQLAFTSRRDSASPQIFLRAGDGTVRQLTSGMDDAADPRLSPDGTLVAFDAAQPLPRGGTQRDLWLVHTDGTGLRRLTDTTSDETDPTFSPDGTHIAYSSDATGTPEIYSQALAGGPAFQLTTNGPATQPMWNPVHANLIAYTDGAGGNQRLNLIDGTQSGIAVLEGAADTVASFSPTWQPNGDDLTFVSTENGVNEVFDVDIAGGVPLCGCQLQLLLDENRGDDTPTWLDGQLVIARSTAADQQTADVEDVLPDGADPRDLGLSVLHEDPGASTDANLLFNPSPGFDPWFIRQDYSPDGREFVVTRFLTVDGLRTEELWLANADGSDARRLQVSDSGPGDWDTDPVWSPDGTLIAFARRSPGGVAGSGAGVSRIFIANVATGQVVAALPGQNPMLDDAQPSFSPDGRTLVFTRVADINGSLANKHIWLAPVADLSDQHDLTAQVCGAQCPVIDDSPAFSSDGSEIAFNRTNDGLLFVSTDGTRCRVLFPAGQNSCAGTLNAPSTGPFQPRDVAFSPDGSQIVLTTRRAADPASPEMLAEVDVATGALTPIDEDLPGRQKEPSWQDTVDLAVTAPASTPVVTLDGSRTVTVTVTNRGPAPSPGTVLTMTVPPGLRLTGLRPEVGSCVVATRQCALGTLADGQSMQVLATLVGVRTGTAQVSWSVTGTVADPAPAQGTALTLVPVQNPAMVPAPPPPTANPALAVRVAPAPGYVGGTVTVTFTARDTTAGAATGLTLHLALPSGIPIRARGPGCTASTCALPGLRPGSATTVQVVLAPTAAGRTTVSGTLTTTGTDADHADDTASAALVVLQPKIVAVPAVGPPGFVTSVRGIDFPPGAPVTLTWTPGITAVAAPTVPLSDGTFVAQLLILPKDETGPRVITASGPGFSPVTTPFLVVAGTYSPPSMVVRR